MMQLQPHVLKQNIQKCFLIHQSQFLRHFFFLACHLFQRKPPPFNKHPIWIFNLIVVEKKQLHPAVRTRSQQALQFVPFLKFSFRTYNNLPQFRQSFICRNSYSTTNPISMITYLSYSLHLVQCQYQQNIEPSKSLSIFVTVKMF